MPVIETVGKRHKLLIPPIVASLVAANEKDGGPARIEYVQRAQWPAAALGPQFPHGAVTGPIDFRAMRET